MAALPLLTLPAIELEWLIPVGGTVGSPNAQQVAPYINLLKTPKLRLNGPLLYIISKLRTNIKSNTKINSIDYDPIKFN